MALDYKALVTLSEFRNRALEASAIADDSDNDSYIEDYIEDATQIIENYLDRQLIVRRQRDYYEDIYWFIDKSVSQSSDTQRSNYMNQWPVVEIVDILPAVITTNPSIHNDGRRVYTTDTNLSLATEGFGIVEEIEYFAGYRRADHTTIGVLQADTGASDLSSLSTLPTELPWDIRQVCIRIALYYVVNTASGKVGHGPVIQEVAGSSLNLGIPEQQFIDMELRKLNKYKRWV